MDYAHGIRLVALASTLVWLSACEPAGSGPGGEAAPHEMAFGMPEAQVLTEQETAPPVMGAYLTMAPEVATLDYEGNRTHDVRIDTFGQEIEVAGGSRFRAWTFGGTIPGPVLTVREGDRIRFTMRNRSDEEVAITEPSQASPYLEQLGKDPWMRPEVYRAPMPHSMDFHAATVAADDKWRTIAPGQTITFEWVANYPGVFMYHCGTPSVLMHVAMGQYGSVIVLPRSGYPDHADREFALVQSELYLGSGGELRPYDHGAAMAKTPTLVVFNGHRSRHIDRPLEVKEGDRVRLYVLNAGPSLISSFHVIGAVFDKVYPEGNVENVQRGMQTITLGASQGAVVEFIVPEAGEYMFVDHAFAHAERGAAGVIRAAPRE